METVYSGKLKTGFKDRLNFAFLCALTLLSFPAPVFSEIRPAGIFTDNMVLQCDEPVRVWGTAEPGETVTIEFAGQKKITAANAGGQWQVQLDPLPASSEPCEMIFKSSVNNLQSTIINVLVGEVWLAGGQSNMASTMGNYMRTVKDDVMSANDSLLRVATVPRLDYSGENDSAPEWKMTNPQTVRTFSATAYYFGKNLRDALDVPVGIIVCAVGATPAEAWMSRKTLEADTDLKKVIDAYDSHVKKTFPDESSFTEYLKEYDRLVEEWLRKKAERQKVGWKPEIEMSCRNFKRPGGLYETMLKQVIPYTIRGVIWYQGENNANNHAAAHYRKIFPALINEWRADFNNPDLPFLFVQLATFGGKDANEPQWAELREVQRWTEKNVQNTGMAVLVDGGEEKDIHPHSKPEAGRRLGLLARNIAYGENNLICRGPELKESKVSGSVIELTFNTPDVRLIPVSGTENAFEICGEDRKFVAAGAVCRDGKIIVSSPEINNPVFVRYGWKKWFVPSLFNTAGLPASPFRTDDFPFVTKGRFYLDSL
ncbi:MAG: sialate O-acetylesterase [Kiritimatiellales bacterium]